MAFGKDGRADTMGLRADWPLARPILAVARESFVEVVRVLSEIFEFYSSVLHV